MSEEALQFVAPRKPILGSQSRAREGRDSVCVAQNALSCLALQNGPDESGMKSIACSCRVRRLNRIGGHVKNLATALSPSASVATGDDREPSARPSQSAQTISERTCPPPLFGEPAGHHRKIDLREEFFSAGPDRIRIETDGPTGATGRPGGPERRIGVAGIKVEQVPSLDFSSLQRASGEV